MIIREIVLKFFLKKYYRYEHKWKKKEIINVWVVSFLVAV